MRDMTMKKRMTALFLIAMLLLTGCAQNTDSGSAKKSSKQTVQEKTEQKKDADKKEEPAEIKADAPKKESADAPDEAPAEPEIWTATEMPVHLRYDRMWGYGAFGETDDPELIAEAVDAIRAIRIIEPTDMSVDDYSDYLNFTFADGSETRLVFEEQIWVVDREQRYRVEGLKTLRSILDPLIEEEE